MDTVYIRLEPTNIQPAWCDTCMSTSGVTYDIATIGDQGVTTLGHGCHCPECDDSGGTP